ncbi:MAG: phosphatase PAP2 family protein [Candidatus Firestonebacteria bacterium]
MILKIGKIKWAFFLPILVILLFLFLKFVPLPDVFQKLDTSIFYFVNHSLKNKFLDYIMPIITEIKNWRIPFGLIWLGLLIWGGKKGRHFVILSAFTLLLSDQFSSHILKDYFARIRPSDCLKDANVLVGYGSYSFPSSHAVNMFAITSLILYFYRKVGYFFIFLACTVGFSRLYVGVHYPFDVFGGAIIGVSIALIMIVFYEVIILRKNEK